MVSQNAASLPEEPDFEQIASEMEASGEFNDTTVDPPQSEAEPVAEPESAPEPEVEGTEEPQTSETRADAEPEDPPQSQERPRTKLTDLPEFQEYQSKRDREFSELQKRLQQIESEKAQAEASKQVDEQVEAHLRSEEQKGMALGYSEEEVKRMVRDPERVRQTKDYFRQQRELQTYQQAIHTAGKRVAVQQFATQYNVAPEDQEILYSTETPEAMEALAKRLGRQRQESTGQKETRRSAVPPETRDTAPVGSRSDASVKPGFWDLIESAEQKDYGEMSPEERQAVDLVMAGRIPE